MRSPVLLLVVRDNTITGNESNYSGVLFSRGKCDLTTENNIISGNTVYGDYLLHFFDRPSATCTGNTISDDATGGHCIYAYYTPMFRDQL
jgi:hypothetical protein